MATTTKSTKSRISRSSVATAPSVNTIGGQRREVGEVLMVQGCPSGPFRVVAVHADGGVAVRLVYGEVVRTLGPRTLVEAE